MIENVQFRIDVEAANALTQWKAVFAHEVCERAKLLAAQSDRSDSVTLLHYRKAAETALQSLSAAIQNGDAPDVGQEAA